MQLPLSVRVGRAPHGREHHKQKQMHGAAVDDLFKHHGDRDDKVRKQGQIGRDLVEARKALQAQFTEEEQVNLTLMINIINGWNRMAVGFGLWFEPAAAKAPAQKTAEAVA